MKDPKRPVRKSIRLKTYDYSTPGFYFVTICTNYRKCLFCDFSEQEMILNDTGQMIEEWFNEITRKYSFVKIDKFIVMPNHFHGLIQIVGADLRVRPELKNVNSPELNEITNNNKNEKPGRHTGLPLRDQNIISLGDVIKWFKTMTTNAYIKGVKQNNWQPFNDKLWQRNYYEHVIRNDIDLSETRDYIMNNPMKWHIDRNNPQNWGTQRTINNV